jgi:hypothetical protein
MMTPSPELESISANCRRYQADSEDILFPEEYIHCDGTQLKLIDSSCRFGREQYQSIEYYQWPAGSDGQLLFIFPTRVSLTTITLHYYSDSVRGLPRLRLYAVPDDLDVWDTVPSGTPYVGVASVPPDSKADIAGRRSININTDFNTKKVLVYKFSSSFSFSLSEVEFFINCSK